MASQHAALQKECKKLLELCGWYVIENKKGQSSRKYNTGEKGIADLLAVMPGNEILWLEIKTINDTQKKDQKLFEEKISKYNHKYFLVYDISAVIAIVRKYKEK